MAFSSCEQSLEPSKPRDTLIIELMEATLLLGIKPANVRIFDFPVRKFNNYRQEILEEMVKVNKELKPDIVFLPSTYDTHQDHNTISNEGFRAFKTTSLLGYELPWNNMQFNTSAFILLQKKNIDRKIKAINCYKSQINRMYASSEAIMSNAIMRGVQVGASYAEAFELIRMIVK